MGKTEAKNIIIRIQYSDAEFKKELAKAMDKIEEIKRREYRLKISELTQDPRDQKIYIVDAIVEHTPTQTDIIAKFPISYLMIDDPEFIAMVAIESAIKIFVATPKKLQIADLNSV